VSVSTCLSRLSTRLATEGSRNFCAGAAPDLRRWLAHQAALLSARQSALRLGSELRAPFAPGFALCLALRTLAPPLAPPLALPTEPRCRCANDEW
jgi:hypothetical protein